MQIVQQLLGEVEAASAAMLAGLLARLKGPIQLPECLRVVGCLRRLAAFPEPELRRRYAAWMLPWMSISFCGMSVGNVLCRSDCEGLKDLHVPLPLCVEDQQQPHMAWSVCRFLQCREQWLAEVVAELDDSSIYEYLKRLTDVHRLQLFDVVMQFRAIFSEDEAAPQYPPPKPSASSAPAPESDGGAVYSWAEHRL